MPAPKYYCDYCDKTFIDAPAARRRHFSGPQHQRAKKQWFDSFKEEAQAPAQGFSRGVCAQFSCTGFCPYGDQCKFAHLLPGAAWVQQAPQGRIQGPPIVMKPGASTLPENNLPPSLQPPREDLLNYLPPVEWG